MMLRPVVLAICFGAAAPARAEDPPDGARDAGPAAPRVQDTFTYRNPVTEGPDWIRDAFILRVGGRYDMTGTSRIGSGTTPEEMWPGFYLWSSNDLRRWTRELLVVSNEDEKINEGSTLLKINGIYYLFWSCNSWGYFVGYATAENIRGPYTKNPRNPVWGAAKPEFREAAKATRRPPLHRGRPRLPVPRPRRAPLARRTRACHGWWGRPAL